MTAGPDPQLTRHNRNTRWSRVVSGCLAAAGIDRIVLCPGGRSAALALCLADQPGLTATVMNDERAAGFFALGLARARGCAVALSVTSGSAVANLLPALLEAAALGVPLLVLTADRPLAEHGGGGPQWADHLALCRPAVRRRLALGEPDADALADLRRDLDRFLGDWLADAPGRGPAQINLPFHGAVSSLDADPEPAGSPRPGPPARPMRPAAPPPADPIAALGLPPARRGLIVAGSDCPFAVAHVAALAARTGFPLLADAASGLRRPGVPTLVAAAEVVCRGPAAAARVPDLVIQIGKAPADHGLHRFLARQPCPVLLLDRQAAAGDFLGRSAIALACGDGEPLAAIGAAVGAGDPGWARAWLAEGARAGALVAAAAADLAWGEVPAAAIVCNAPGFRLLHLGNSMPIRLGNLLARPGDAPQRILANRGVNGIDGTIASFLGACAGLDTPGLALIGDQTFRHDFAALDLAAVSGARGALCVVSNGGGALFDFLPGQHLPRFAATIRAPRPVPVAALAAAFGLPHHRCADRATLTAALDGARTGRALHLVEIVVPPHSARDGLQLLFASLAAG